MTGAMVGASEPLRQGGRLTTESPTLIPADHGQNAVG